MSNDNENKEEANNPSFLNSLFGFKLKLPSGGPMLIGFLMIAAVSGWLNLKQARVVDSAGDVLDVMAEKDDINLSIAQLNRLKKDPETKPKEKESIDEEIRDKNKRLNDLNFELSEQKLDVKENSAGVLNGSWFWTVFIQVGAGLFGMGVIHIIQSKNEDSRVRSAAVIVIGFVVIFLLISRILVTQSSSEFLLKFIL